MEVLYAASKFNSRKRSSKIEVIKALNVLGFTTWNELQSGNLLVICKLGSVAGPVIQANGRLTFEDDLRSGGLLCFTTQ